MSRLYYMSLPGVGAWDFAIKESGAQLAPYRAYLTTAKKAAEERALVLAWRRPTNDEERVLNQRLHERHEETVRKRATASRRRDRQAAPPLPRGFWVVLEPRKGRSEEPETTFDAFLKAEKVYDLCNWSNDYAIEPETVDEEARALLLTRLPNPIEPSEDEPEGVDELGARLHGPLLYLRPNTWTLDCQRRSLEKMEDRPSPRIAPLLRLVSTRPQWSEPEEWEVGEHEWAFLTRNKDGSLRDGTAEQREFVTKVLGTPDFAVLEGTPGSGKTTAICELIIQLARLNKRVLLVASTHVAVDNVLERLIEWQDEEPEKGQSPREKLVLPIRIGDESNVSSDAVGAWILKYLERTWKYEILDHLERPIGAEVAGAPARALLKEALNRRGEESALTRLLLESSNLVCGTTIGILQHPAIKAEEKWWKSQYYLSGADRVSAMLKNPPPSFEPFDIMILDEASKTTFTEFLVPAAFARRWVVVGDIRQLSPYVEEQDLAENLRGFLPPEVARAATHTFLVSDAVRPGERVASLVGVTTEDEADLFAAEAEARGVTAVDLTRVEPVTIRGIDNAVPELLFAELVYGDPETLWNWQHRLPGDLVATAGRVPPLPGWEGHRNTLGLRLAEDPPDWADEVAWRLVRAYELRQNPADQRRLLDELTALVPKTLDDWYFRFRKLRPREFRDGTIQTPNALLEADLANVRRVAMPSILEILQRGAGDLGWDNETVLTHGLPEDVLESRMVSLQYQHRMHPEVAAFPRSEFYAEDGLLNDASGMAQARAWTYPRYARRALWLDIKPADGGRRGRGSKNANPAEVDAVMEELRAFVEWAQSQPRPGKNPNAPWEVAILTFYRGQEAELRKRLQRASGQPGNTRNFRFGRVHVTLCTVDRFQGHEADLVLLSFVKSNGAVGFLNSPNRLNVALTRARFQIVLVGHRTGFASERCKSELLRRLATSNLYAHNLGWGPR